MTKILFTTIGEIFMKTIILLSMLVTSSFAYSEVVPSDRLSDVIQAIKDSFITKDLDCTETVSGRNTKASTLNWDAVSGAELTINENQQPVIVLHRDASQQDSEYEYYDTTIKVTTNSDYTVVEEIQATQNESPKIIRKNVGTIINPIYKDIQVKGKLYQKVECK